MRYGNTQINKFYLETLKGGINNIKINLKGREKRGCSDGLTNS
jgi:hypothetical protein